MQLLHDLQQVFGSGLVKGDWVPTEVLLLHLRKLDGAPWADMDITGHRIGKLLGEFGIKSVRNPARTKRGYEWKAFGDAWQRYPMCDQGDSEVSEGEEPPGYASEPSGSVHTPSEQGKHADTSPTLCQCPTKRPGKCPAVLAGQTPSGRFRTVRTHTPPRTRAGSARRPPDAP